MKFSAQEEYGLRCLLQIARLPVGESMTIPQISELEGITPTHVAKLLMILRKDGFVTATRGQQGGYMLARRPADIPVGEVLASLGGRLYDAEFCARYSGQMHICAHAVDCSVRSLWQVIQSAVDQAIERVSLEDLLATKPTTSNVTLFDTPARPAQLAPPAPIG